MPPTWFILFMIAVAAAGFLLRLPAVRALLSTRPRHSAEREALPYRAHPYLLSKGEAAFYHSLRRAVGDRYAVAMKVRLSDVLSCPGKNEAARHRNRIIQKHVDFVLVEPTSTKIVAVVELDDRSHDRPDRQERDGFLDAAMSAAGLPLLHFKANANYDAQEIARRIQEVLPPTGAAATVHQVRPQDAAKLPHNRTPATRH